MHLSTVFCKDLLFSMQFLEISAENIIFLLLWQVNFNNLAAMKQKKNVKNPQKKMKR